MAKWRILAVDDEPLNLDILGEYLDNPDYIITTAENGQLAWEAMEADAEPPHLVILDRMMPVMDGMTLLRKIKSDDRFKHIPVIMQTAASAPEQVREGMAAGAWYYLTKPYSADSLTSLVSAAISHIFQREQVLAITRETNKALSLVTHAEFRFNDMHSVSALVTALSNLGHDPAAVAMGLTELLINAVEHGNLGITYAEKKNLRLNGGWEDEIARRAGMEPYCSRHVLVELVREADSLVFTITDQGKGFDWQRYLDFDPDRAYDPNGRGIAMARNACFSSLEYRGNGNTVVARIPLRPDAQAA